MKQPVALVLMAILLATLLSAPALALSQEDTITAVYFTGIGCSHCAKVDPVLFHNWTEEYPSLVIVEYEVFKQRDNAPIILSYNDMYHTGTGVPLLFFSENETFAGDTRILENTPAILASFEADHTIPDGRRMDIETEDIASLPGLPKIWHKDRVLIKESAGGNTEDLKRLLLSDNVTETLDSIPYTTISPSPMPLSGGEIGFQHAVKLTGWVLEWNDAAGPAPTGGVPTPQTTASPEPGCNTSPQISLPTVVSLALVDAINPCALAVLILMLVTVTTNNPAGKRDVLLSGGSFTIAVFICYFLYGVALTLFFQTVQELSPVRLLLYDLLGGVAIVLGSVHLLDFFSHHEGKSYLSIPDRFRPRIGSLLSRMISPLGAFILGAFVSVFLLPCTIGPYILGCGILSVLGLIQVLPYLLLYNLIFILPMIGITLLVFFGIGTAEAASGWRDRQVKRLHLISGVIMLLIGIAMISGLF